MVEWQNTRKREHKYITAELISHFTPKGVGVEIGVNEGQTSHYWLSETQVSHVYMIDPWKTFSEWATQEVVDGFYEFCCTFSEIFPGRATVIRKKSEDAHLDVPDELDFIFIDGNHKYDFITKDLKFWIPKVRSGGLVMGHDWTKKFNAIERAVTEFRENNDVLQPPFESYDEFNFEWTHVPAPTKSPVVNKSWPKGTVWWSIKK